MKDRRHRYSESFTEYLQKKYAIMSAGVFLVVMMISAPFLGANGIASLIGQDTTTETTTSETTMPTDMPSDMDNIQWDGNEESGGQINEIGIPEPSDDWQQEDMGDMNQPNEDWQKQDMNMQEPQEPMQEEPMRQEQVCGQDGKTYTSEDEATSAGTEMEHWGECGKASAREIRDMERQMKGSNDFDFPRLTKDLKRSVKKIDQVIKGIEKYVAKAEKKGISGDFTTYTSGKIAELTADKSDMEAIASDIVRYQGMAKTYLEELKNRLSAVKSGERNGQYFWNYSSRQDLFWLMKDAAERHVDKYRNEGYYDFLREFVKQRFEAAVQGVIASVDWSVQDDIEQHFSDQRAQIDAIIEQMDAIQVEAESLLNDESLNRDDFESARQDLRDERDSIMSDMEDIWELDRDFWDSEPWREMDAIWKEIQWAQESSFALKDLENMIAEINVARKVMPVGASIYEEPAAIKTWNELAKLIDEKVMPAAEKAKEKALELHNPEVIWHFFDKVMDPLTRYIEPKIGYLADLF
ncbi:hypothetical protein HZA41_02760, partial [Candidatus Peregrinibacteria bacterium]|nr:hypothetical protein [Candidatus Peregrinibacteria bacterium]